MPQVPVAVLTGATGSGKTTLLQAALRAGALPRTAVVADGFVDAGIGATDAQLRILPGGCVCCEARDDLEIALLRLGRSAARGEIPAFERVVIETSGAAEPAPVLQLVAGSPAVSAAYWVESVVAVVDAGRGDAALVADSTTLRQAQFADRVLFTRWEGLAAQPRTALETRLAHINPHAERVFASSETSAPAWFAGAPPRIAQLAPAAGWRAAHDEAVQSFALCWEEPQPLVAIGKWLHALAAAHGPRLLRARGIVAATGDMEAIAIHVVGPVVAPPAFLARQVPASCVVFTARGLEPCDTRPPWTVREGIFQGSG